MVNAGPLLWLYDNYNDIYWGTKIPFHELLGPQHREFVAIHRKY